MKTALRGDRLYTQRRVDTNVIFATYEWYSGRNGIARATLL